MIKRYDIAVIGSGPAGEKAAIEAASLGAKTVIIEKGVKPGGAGLITGTIPSKSLRETVKYVESLSQSSISGIDICLDRKLTVQELMYRKERVIEHRVNDILGAYEKDSIDFIAGMAEFNSLNQLVIHKNQEIGNKKQETSDITVRAEKIIIAVGTKPYHPDHLNFDAEYILDSDTILQLKDIPESLVVIGGGVIGCEYATIFAKMGTEVTIVDSNMMLLNFIDHDISNALADEMQKDGVRLKLGTAYKKVEVLDNHVVTTLMNGEKIKTSALLCASGREGMTDGLNLKVCGLQTNSRNQLEVNSNYQTAVPNIYAVGDVIGFPSLVSVSNEEGRMAAQHAVSNKEVSRIGSDIPYGIYTIPEISMTGLTEEQAKKEKIPYGVGICQFKDLARGLIIGSKQGMLKLIFHSKTHKLLGVHIFGQSAAELIHIGQSVIAFNGSIDYFLKIVFNFPTLSAAYKVAARNALEIKQ
ncbi:MAG: Si-specific NAD(P)(+) transhydrogenase [Deltaproteobacteria bacterium]|nr:Si-specific NAD(P)(+) transhydrogenase [Deltaproteobacteria bacterium]